MKAVNKTNTGILFSALWTLAFLFTGTPSFAQNVEDLFTTEPRNAFEVSYAVAEEAVVQSLTEKGVGDKVSASINGRKSKPIFVYNKPITVETRGLKFDKQSGHWEASLLFLSGSDVISALPASGHFDEMIEVAVLKREMRNTDVISARDIEIRDFSQNHIRTDTITDLSGLIGKSPLRTISPFRPIRAAEVVNQPILKKDALVSMRYSMPGMEISTSGQAMMAGAKGDVISVRNTTSKKIVQAIIQDSSTVSILATGVDHAQND